MRSSCLCNVLVPYQKCLFGAVPAVPWCEVQFHFWRSRQACSFQGIWMQYGRVRYSTRNWWWALALQFVQPIGRDHLGCSLQFKEVADVSGAQRNMPVYFWKCRQTRCSVGSLREVVLGMLLEDYRKPITPVHWSHWWPFMVAGGCLSRTGRATQEWVRLCEL